MLFTWYSSGTHETQAVTIGFLAYNIIAFGFQPIIGYLRDTYRKIPLEIISCTLLIIGLLFIRVPAVSISLMGLGNACFHIAGGAYSLRQSGGKMAKSGIFVSSGTLGVAFGTISGKNGKLPVCFQAGALLLCFVLVYILCVKRAESKETAFSAARTGLTNTEMTFSTVRTVLEDIERKFSTVRTGLKDTERKFSIVRTGLTFELVIFLAFVSILIRSYAGSIIPTEWRTTTLLFIFPAVGAFIGKAFGGFIADRTGAREAAVYSLLAAMVFLTFGYMNPWIYLFGIVLFNINMSVTLCAIASLLPQNPGLAFGITTLALLCGNVPAFFITVTQAPLVFAVLTAVSAVCLSYILKGKVW